MDLKKNKSDYAVSFLKSITPFPIAGPFVHELVSHLIPNQRIDRITEFVWILDRKLKVSRMDIEKLKSTDENFIILSEDAFAEAAKSTTQERKEYIANILINGINSNHVDLVESRHLLKTLGSINNIEILILHTYSVRERDKHIELEKKYSDIFKNKNLIAGASEEEKKKHAIFQSYLEHLANLGLLEKVYKWKVKGFASESSRPEKPKITYEITSFGILFLKSIDLYEN